MVVHSPRGMLAGEALNRASTASAENGPISQGSGETDGGEEVLSR
jgi:hypothetical protein